MTGMYVLHVTTGEERSIADDLRNMGYETIVPETETIIRRKRELARVMTVLMPGYVFASGDVDEETYYDIVGVSGVIRILNFGEPLCDEDVATVMRLAGMRDALRVRKQDDGSYVILDGVLAGHESSLVSVDRRQHRAMLRVDLMGRPVDIQVSAVVVAE